VNTTNGINTEEEIGESHFSTSNETPIRNNAFELDDDAKIEGIARHFKEIMNILGLDLQDVKELFNGLNPDNKPAITLFENSYKYNEILVEKDIKLYSNCEHHFVPIIGFAHIGYVSSGKVIGLSKLHRIVDYYARRPQVQERLTNQVAIALKDALDTEDVAVVIHADHQCVSMRGVKDQTSSTITSYFGGIFENAEKRNEFLNLVKVGNVNN
jgi:GTP cyclohydrolase I